MGWLKTVGYALGGTLAIGSLVIGMSIPSTNTVASSHSKTNSPNVTIVQSSCEDTATNASGGSAFSGTITLDDIRKCKSRKEYLELVMPAYAADCASLGIKYPGVLALQGIYETGMPDNIAPSAEADNNLGGLKYSTSIPGATKGSISSEGDPYSHFEYVSDYIYAQCWQVSTDTYAKVREQNDVASFTNVLCWIWVKGNVDGATNTPVAYSPNIIQDYSTYGLASYENGGSGSVSGTSSSSSSSSSSTSSTTNTSSTQLKIVSHHQWEANDRSDPTDDFPLDSYANTGSHNGTAGDASKVNIDKSTLNDEKGGHGTLSDVKYIVLHSTESKTDSATAVINGWNNFTGDDDGVGAHFVVDKTGHVYQWVDISLIAWHAGAHQGNLYDFSDLPDDSMNDHSIGIEIVHDRNTGDYPEEQLTAVDNLIAWIEQNVGKNVNVSSQKTGKCDNTDSSKDSNSSSSNVQASGNMSGIVAYAKTMLGLGYSSPGDWQTEGAETDCSGLICRCYKYGGNVDLTTLGDNIRTAESMRISGHFKTIDQSELQPGDIICCTPSGSDSAAHVVLYEGDGKIIHESEPGVGCIESQLSDFSSWTLTCRRFIG